MKKFYMLMVAMLCGVAAFAQESVYFKPIKVEKGETEATLEVCLKAQVATSVASVSTRIQLPEGVSYKLSKNNPKMVANGDLENGHSTKVMECTDGNYQFSIYSASPFEYEEMDGVTEIDDVIFTVPLLISEEVAAVDGTYPIKLYMMSVANTSSESLTLNGTFPTEYEDAAGLTVGAGTGIIGINADDTNAPIYNVAGQRVSKAQKGIFIQNGKKVAVK